MKESVPESSHWSIRVKVTLSWAGTEYHPLLPLSPSNQTRYGCVEVSYLGVIKMKFLPQLPILPAFNRLKSCSQSLKELSFETRGVCMCIPTSCPQQTSVLLFSPSAPQHVYGKGGQKEKEKDFVNISLPHRRAISNKNNQSSAIQLTDAVSFCLIRALFLASITVASMC